MLLNKFSPMIGAASPNRVGVADGGKNQHGRAARGGVGGGGALPVGQAGGKPFMHVACEQKIEGLLAFSGNVQQAVTYGCAHIALGFTHSRS